MGAGREQGNTGLVLPRGTEEPESRVRVKAAFCMWAEPEEKRPVLMDPSAEGPRVGAADSGSSRAEGPAVPLPTPATIRAPAQSSGSALIEQNVNYSARPE